MLDRDERTGFLYQVAFGYKVFLRNESDYLGPDLLNWVCRDIYFKFYEPAGEDVVVDIGAGYGHEAFYVMSKSPGVRYFGVEVQPSVYECLCNSFRPVRERCRAISFAVSEHEDYFLISSAQDYTSVSTLENGYIEVPALPWKRLLNRYGIERIDLLKVNIEGAERMLLPAIGDMSEIKRVIISAHDFRSDRGEGEHFRTREFVMNYLLREGYQVRPVGEDGWVRNWLYAERAP